MSAYSIPDFVTQDHGTCELCREDNVDLYCIPDYMWVCQSCLENEMDVCDECGQIWASDAIEFTETEDGRMICEYCMEDMEYEEEDEEE